MQAGKLRHLISIQTPSTGQNEFGEPSATWVPFADAYASVETLTGREVFAAQQQLAQTPTLFKMRYVAGITEAMRVVFKGRVFNIVSVADPDGRLRTLEVLGMREAGNEQDESSTNHVGRRRRNRSCVS